MAQDYDQLTGVRGLERERPASHRVRDAGHDQVLEALESGESGMT